MLPSLSELAPACFELLLQVSAGLAAPTSARSHLRSGQTNFATARATFGAFARQGHLDRPVLVVTNRGSGLASRNARRRPESELSRERRAPSIPWLSSLSTNRRSHNEHPLGIIPFNEKCDLHFLDNHSRLAAWRVKPGPLRVQIARKACASLGGADDQIVCISHLSGCVSYFTLR